MLRPDMYELIKEAVGDGLKCVEEGLASKQYIERTFQLSRNRLFRFRLASLQNVVIFFGQDAQRFSRDFSQTQR